MVKKVNVVVENPLGLIHLEDAIDAVEEEIAAEHPTVTPLRRELDKTIFAYRCNKCGYTWKIYQNPCGCYSREEFEPVESDVENE